MHLNARLSELGLSELDRGCVPHWFISGLLCFLALSPSKLYSTLGAVSLEEFSVPQFCAHPQPRLPPTGTLQSWPLLGALASGTVVLLPKGRWEPGMGQVYLSIPGLALTIFRQISYITQL